LLGFILVEASYTLKSSNSVLSANSSIQEGFDD
jgi:hypothetical protein